MRTIILGLRAQVMAWLLPLALLMAHGIRHSLTLHVTGDMAKMGERHCSCNMADSQAQLMECGRNARQTLLMRYGRFPAMLS